MAVILACRFLKINEWSVPLLGQWQQRTIGNRSAGVYSCTCKIQNVQCNQIFYEIKSKMESKLLVLERKMNEQTKKSWKVITVKVYEEFLS